MLVNPSCIVGAARKAANICGGRRLAPAAAQRHRQHTCSTVHGDPFHSGRAELKANTVERWAPCGCRAAGSGGGGGGGGGSSCPQDVSAPAMATAPCHPGEPVGAVGVSEARAISEPAVLRPLPPHASRWPCRHFLRLLHTSPCSVVEAQHAVSRCGPRASGLGSTGQPLRPAARLPAPRHHLAAVHPPLGACKPTWRPASSGSPWAGRARCCWHPSAMRRGPPSRWACCRACPTRQRCRPA